MKSEKCISDDVDMVEWKSSKMINRALRYGKDDEDGELNGLRRRKRRRENIRSESVRLFRKYLVRRSSSTSSSSSSSGSEKKRKIMEEELQMMKKKWCHGLTSNNEPTRPLFPSELGACLSRPPSILERGLFPMLNLISKEASSTTTRASSISRCGINDDKGLGAQLTIFCAGLVNVYDNVPLDKAQAIMLLAGGNSLSETVIATEIPPPPLSPSPPPPAFDSSTVHYSHFSNNLKPAGLPMARRYSLQCFLEKRRGRIINKSLL